MTPYIKNSQTKTSTKLESNENQKFQKVLPNTAKVLSYGGYDEQFGKTKFHFLYGYGGDASIRKTVFVQITVTKKQYQVRQVHFHRRIAFSISHTKHLIDIVQKTKCTLKKCKWRKKEKKESEHDQFLIAHLYIFPYKL